MPIPMSTNPSSSLPGIPVDNMRPRQRISGFSRNEANASKGTAARSQHPQSDLTEVAALCRRY